VAKNRAGKEIKDDLLRYLGFIQASLNKELMDDIGTAVTIAMLQFIEKGISPIEGKGRFPAYKWAAFSRDVKKSQTFTKRQVREIQAKAKKLAKGGNKKKAQRLREDAATLSSLSKQAGATAGAKYPFSTDEYRRGAKRLRPVNLFLSGKFLRALEFRLNGVAGRYNLEIGFFDSNEAEKEEGHRDGANGQPKRPIIPIDREDFAQVIQNEIWKRVEATIDKAAASGK
jgi:hypothetical protein